MFYQCAFVVTCLAGGLSATAQAQDLNNTQSTELETIFVYGRQQEDSAENIPQSFTVHSYESMNIGLAESVGDVLRLEPNSSISGSERDMFSGEYLLRGFNSEQSTNGLGFTRTDHPTDLANVERIEVLKGPASVLYGQMEPGGTINVVTKQPLPYFYGQISSEVGSYNAIRQTLDVTGPLSDKVRARLNLAYSENDSSIDFSESKRTFIAPNITMDLSAKTNLTIEGSYYQNDWTALHGGAPLEGSVLDNPNGDYDKSFNPSGPDGYTERDSQNTNVRLTHALTDKVNARVSYTHTHNEADWQEQAPFGLDSDNRTLDRIVFTGEDTYKTDDSLILDLNGEFDTGDVTHKFLIGIDYLEGDLYRPTKIYSIDSINLYNPQYSAVELNGSNLVRDRTTLQDDEVKAFFAQDRVRLGAWQLSAGLRYIESKQSQTTINNSTNASSSSSISQSDWTTQLGVIYNLTKDTSLYVNRSESFVPQQGTTSGALPLEAEEGTQYEIGTRFKVGKLQANIASFVITKDNIAIEDPLDDDFEVAEGRARSQGVELSLSGYVNPNLYIMAAYGYTDTEILHSDDKDLEGNRFKNVPLNTASFQTRYYIESLPGLSVGGTVVYTGERYFDDENSAELPDTTRVDLIASYEISDALQADFLVNNVFDEEIFSPGSYDGVIREDERTFQARVKYAF